MTKQGIVVSDNISKKNYKKIESHFSINNANSLKQMVEILSVMSKLDALEIFVLAKDGLKSELETPQKIGLTKKQYYTRLKQLCDLNLITKKDENYAHTTFGSVVYQKHIAGLLGSLSNIKELEMIDILKTSSRFNQQEISQFLMKVGFDNNVTAIEKSSFKIMENYEEMVSKAMEMVEFAKTEILLMTRHSNDLIINAILKKANMGVKVKILADVNMIEQYVSNQANKIVISDKNDDERTKVVTNPFYPEKIERRYAKIPFGIFMTDDLHVGVEIVDSYNPQKYARSIYIDDASMSKQMKSIFDQMWQVSSVNPPQLVTRNT